MDTSELELPVHQVAFEHIESFDFSTGDVIEETVFAGGKKLVDLARYAARVPGYRESHRGFYVGSGASTYDAAADSSRIGVFATGNFKASVPEDERGEEDVDDIDKVCAEIGNAILADNNGMQRVAFMVVAATTNSARIREVNGEPTPTLYPCLPCNDTMKRSSLFDAQTIIMSIGAADEDNIFQVQNVGELNERYLQREGGETPKPLETYTYSPHIWGAAGEYYRSERKRRNPKASVGDPHHKRVKSRSKLALEALRQSVV